MKVVLIVVLVIFSLAENNTATDCIHVNNRNLYEFAAKAVNSLQPSDFLYTLTDCIAAKGQKSGNYYYLKFRMDATSYNRTETKEDRIVKCIVKPVYPTITCLAKIKVGQKQFDMKLVEYGCQ